MKNSLSDLSRALDNWHEDMSSRRKVAIKAIKLAEEKIPLTEKAQEIIGWVNDLNSLTARAFSSGVLQENSEQFLNDLLEIRKNINSLVTSRRTK